MVGHDRTLPTFCHISELGELGYQNLRRMIALSSPLYLWAPSSVLLRNPRSTVPPDEFLRYLEQGYIRIIARHEWPTDPRFRNRHPWGGAAWDGDIDGRIRAIYEEDVSTPSAGDQRVLSAGAATGHLKAEEYLEEHPGSVRAWGQILNGPLAEQEIPPGTLEAARREAEKDLRSAALLLLSIAHNHGQAMREAGADVPILLRTQDSKFLDLVARLYASTNQPTSRRAVVKQARVHQDFAELTGRLIATLEQIETDKTRLDKFMGSPGHDDLAAWVAAICDRVKTAEPGSIDLEVRTTLLEELRRGRFHETRPVEFRRLLRSVETPQLAVDFGLALAGLLGHERFGIGGLGVSAFAVAHAISRRMGWIPGDFTGEQWPFLYATGHEARPRSVRRMEDRFKKP
jgi:hypothetical protein